MLLAIVLLSIALAWVNGLQDAPNAITTSIVTKSLSERTALAYAAVLNVAGVLAGVVLFAFTHATLLSMLGLPAFVAEAGERIEVVLVGALVVTIAWSLAAWWAGMPVSGWSSALSALAGGTASVGLGTVPLGVIAAAMVPIVLSPLLGGGLSFVLTRAIQGLRSKRLVTFPAMRSAQTLSAGLVAAGHGISNGRMPMGFIVLALMAQAGSGAAVPGDAGQESSGPTAAFDPAPLAQSVSGVPIPPWVVVLVALAMGLGTYAGGRRIIHTLGRKLTDLTAAQGLAAESSTAALMYVASMGLGVPVSSSQTITGSIVGSALALSRRAVAWPVFGRIFAWWVATPLVAAMGGAALAFILARVV